ncbi:hypothetical protein F4779DRAFT_640417 [Xylariaceae sp. FL0662B]|nr:hypothetical protein F4779DRAFT_640417 [Xylariaceae sp. FL0662B]
MVDFLANLTPEQLAQIPSGTPPLGIQPSFVNPPSSAPVLIIVGTVLLVIILILAGTRFYVKLAICSKVTSDDWTTLAAVIGTCWYYAICIHAVTKGKFGTHMWDISIAHTLSDDFLIASFFTNWPSGLVWAFAKSSFLLMCLQIFRPLTWLRICVIVGFTSFIYQVPNPGQTWHEGFMNERYNHSFRWTIPIASGSLLLDTYIFILPLIAISTLKLTFKKKIGIMAVFATGLIACVASSLSIYFKHMLNNRLNDYTYWIYPVLLMALLEMCVGISCSCMPSAAGFFNKGGRWTSWSSSAMTMFRSLIRSGKHSDASRDTDNSWAGVNKAGRRHYVDIEMEGNSTYKLTEGHG